MAENPKEYAKLANEGILLGYPVKVAGQANRPDNGVGYHSTIKYFDREKDHPHTIHGLARHLPLNPPDAKNTQVKFDKFKDRSGNDVHVVTLHGNSADKLKENNGKFAHMGFPATFEWTPHVSMDKDTWEKMKNANPKNAHEAGLEFGNAELKRGPKTLKTYHHEPDTDEPKVPDESDFTAKVVAKSELNKGENGDHKKEGYSFEHHPAMTSSCKSCGKTIATDHRIFAHDKNGKPVGSLYYGANQNDAGHSHNSLVASDLRVSEPHRRKGIASEMYRIAEEKSGGKFEPNVNQSKAGQALWSHKNRPFGKSESDGSPKFEEHKDHPIPKNVKTAALAHHKKNPGSIHSVETEHDGSHWLHLNGHTIDNPGQHSWNSTNSAGVLKDIKRIKPCSCGECKKSEPKIKALIKSEHSLHKHIKALALTGDTFFNYIEDHKILDKVTKGK